MQEENMTMEHESENKEESVANEEVEEVNDELDGDGVDKSQTPEEEKIAELEEKLTVAEQKAAENFDLLQRKAAEFQNSKRRQEKLVAEQIERASTRVITKVLPILDDFDLAFRNLPEELNVDEDAWLGGFQQIQKKLLTLLEDEGVETVATEGEFDPNQHEAVSSEPNDEIESGHIIETLRMGYEQKGRTLRPALVRVAM